MRLRYGFGYEKEYILSYSPIFYVNKGKFIIGCYGLVELLFG